MFTVVQPIFLASTNRADSLGYRADAVPVFPLIGLRRQRPLLPFDLATSNPNDF
jgi:hypothetical protein